MKLEELPKETLIELARMYARNWQTLDGLWFGNVEAQYGLEAAIKLDLENWESQSIVEAERIKRALKLNEGGLSLPRAAVKCLVCPPDPHPEEFWCKWELTMKE